MTRAKGREALNFAGIRNLRGDWHPYIITLPSPLIVVSLGRQSFVIVEAVQADFRLRPFFNPSIHYSLVLHQ